MGRRFAILGLLGAAGMLAGCAYDPATRSYQPCCAYAPYAPPAQAYTAPPQAYAQPAYPPPAPSYTPPPQRYAQADTPPPAMRPGPGQRFIARFRAANVTNDGRLTLEQARAGGLVAVVNHFNAIDVGHKGYVTLDDIRAFRAAHPPRHPGQPPDAQPPGPPPAE